MPKVIGRFTNYTDDTVYDALDTKSAVVFVDNFSELSGVDKKLLAGRVVQQRDPAKRRVYNAYGTSYDELRGWSNTSQVYGDAIKISYLQDPDTGGSILSQLGVLSGDREAQANYLVTCVLAAAIGDDATYYNTNIYTTGDLNGFLPSNGGTFSYTRNGYDSDVPVEFKWVADDSSVLYAYLNKDNEYTEWASSGGAVVVYVDSEPAPVGSLSTGDGLTWSYDSNSKNLEFSIDPNGDVLTDDYALKIKTSYDNKTTNVNTSGQGVLYEYLGAGSTSAKHTHTMTDSGVVWISNFQSSTRDKTITVSSTTGVGFTDVKLPFNMVAKVTYKKESNNAIIECSYLRPELMDYASRSALEAKSGINSQSSGGGSILNIDGNAKNKWWTASHKTWDIKILQALSEEHPKTSFKITCTNYSEATKINWYDKNGNASNTVHLPTFINYGAGIEVFVDWISNIYTFTYIAREDIRVSATMDSWITRMKYGEDAIYLGTLKVGNTQ